MRISVAGAGVVEQVGPPVAREIVTIEKLLRLFKWGLTRETELVGVEIRGACSVCWKRCTIDCVVLGRLGGELCDLGWVRLSRYGHWRSWFRKCDAGGRYLRGKKPCLGWVRSLENPRWVSPRR
jgi:hypothetical protein